MESLNRYLVIKTCLQLRIWEDLKYSRGREKHLLSLDSLFLFNSAGQLVGAQWALLAHSSAFPLRHTLNISSPFCPRMAMQAKPSWDNVLYKIQCMICWEFSG